MLCVLIALKARSCGAALIVGLACAVITVLFLLQQFGTGAIGFLFSPILFTWLLFIFGERSHLL